MFMSVFFSWWYTKGWADVVNSFKPRLSTVLVTFSVNQLLQTLFAPWRKIITYPGSSFDDKLKAIVDNLFSRTIGFVVRLFVLFAASVWSLVIIIITIIEIIIWPFLPIAPIGLLIMSLI